MADLSSLTVLNDSLNLSNETKEAIEDYIRRKLVEERYDIIAFYIPVFLSAVLANSLVIFIVIKDRYMRSITNYFLVNLSIADLLVSLICMPEAAIKAYKLTYDLGRYPCKISSYSQCIAVTTSIFTITAMALDRYFAITKPLGFFYRCFNKRATIIVIILLWSTSITLLFPMFIVVDLYSYPVDVPSIDGIVRVNIEICHERWSNFSIASRKQMGILWFLCVFAIPGTVMMFGYAMMGRTLCSVAPPGENDGSYNMRQRNRVIRSRKRVACTLLLLAIVFAICWLPYHIMLLIYDINKSENDTVKELNTYFLLLGHTNSALNPIIYCALSKRFRTSIKDIFACKKYFQRSKTSMQWMGSNGSGTGTQLNHLKSLKTLSNSKAHYMISRINSTQQTTKICAL